MNNIKESLSLFSEVTNVPMADGDYLDAEGFIVCGTCHQRKQQKHNVMGLIHSNCACDKARIDRANAETEALRHRQAVESILHRGRIEPSMRALSFDALDDRAAKVTETCKNYVAGWGAALQHNYGIIFFGNPGTGKSHHAYAIANALAEKEHTVFCGSALDVIAEMQESREKTMRIIKTTDLFLLDDFGASRYTEYQWEQVYNILNTRYNARKPTIITTNLSPEAMEASTDAWMRRAYSRIKEMCVIPLRLDGEDRRTEKAAAARAECRKLYT